MFALTLTSCEDSELATFMTSLRESASDDFPDELAEEMDNDLREYELSQMHDLTSV